MISLFGCKLRAGVLVGLGLAVALGGINAVPASASTLDVLDYQSSDGFDSFTFDSLFEGLETSGYFLDPFEDDLTLDWIDATDVYGVASESDYWGLGQSDDSFLGTSGLNGLSSDESDLLLGALAEGLNDPSPFDEFSGLSYDDAFDSVQGQQFDLPTGPDPDLQASLSSYMPRSSLHPIMSSKCEFMLTFDDHMGPIRAAALANYADRMGETVYVYGSDSLQFSPSRCPEVSGKNFEASEFDLPGRQEIVMAAKEMVGGFVAVGATAIGAAAVRSIDVSFNNDQHYKRWVKVLVACMSGAIGFFAAKAVNGHYQLASALPTLGNCLTTAARGEIGDLILKSELAGEVVRRIGRAFSYVIHKSYLYLASFASSALHLLERSATVALGRMGAVGHRIKLILVAAAGLAAGLTHDYWIGEVGNRDEVVREAMRQGRWRAPRAGEHPNVVVNHA